jgi:adenine-specific DNA-methyltransferase
MDINNYKKIIFQVLKQDDRIWNEDKTELNQTLLLDLVEQIDETVIDLLIQEKDLREKFFVKIKDVYVFKTNDFRFFMEENKVDNSYTSYKNRIGLTDGKKFLKDTNDVVLDFPYKDCILEGGQSTEEGTDTYFEYSEKTENYEEKQGKRKEIFFNTVLAHDEIDRLFDHKALTNWKRFTKDGEGGVLEIKRDNDGTIKENLIIKGNNLLALHSLKKQFAGKVKLIYIDPPYNTGTDGFKYNDNFNHSTWLTFMKNRLEVAKELLKDDGVIFIQCDYNEDSYLRILMDEIFNVENFIANIAVRSSTPSGTKTTHKEKKIIKQKDTILFYKKKNIKIKPQYTPRESWDSHYSMLLIKNSEDDFIIKSLKDELVRLEIIKPNQSLEDININNSKFKEYYLKNSNYICQSAAHKNKEIDKLSRIDNPNKVYVHRENNKIKAFYYNGRQLQPLANGIKPVIKNKKIQNDLANLLCDFWGDIDFQNTQNEGGISFPAGKKPEMLLYRIISMVTESNDIVLDYHLGSGTTCAVAHKMGRQYIGIEQLNYAENDSVVRLQNVINGDQSGISKSVNWQGGGDFIYFELAKWNETAKEKILACESLEELEKFFDEMYERYFLNYNLKIKEFREKVLQEEKFRNLSLVEQKKIFVAMLDNNQMYVNKTEMADKKFGISEEDQRLTEEFYKLSN